MTRERIEDFREIVLPFLSRTLLKTNYENMGKSDAEEFEKDFNEILDLAIKALEQEPVLDKIRAEIETKYGQCKLTEYIVQYDGICTSVNDIGDIADILQIIDKYKTETEANSGNNNY